MKNTQHAQLAGFPLLVDCSSPVDLIFGNTPKRNQPLLAKQYDWWMSPSYRNALERNFVEPLTTYICSQTENKKLN